MMDNDKMNDEQFLIAVDDRPGNVSFFRKKLKKYKLLGSRQQLTQEHVDLFIKIRNFKHQENKTWNEAMDEVLQEYVGTIAITGNQPSINNQMNNQLNNPIPNITPNTTTTSSSETSEIVLLLNQILDTLVKIEQKL